MVNPLEIIVHVPRVHLEPWRVIEPHPAQAEMLRMPAAMPIGMRIPTPPRLLELARPLDQLAVIGAAMLDTIEANKPRFHRARRSATEIYESSGTTILVTGYDMSGEHIIFGTWDYGETVYAPLQRLAEVRRIVRLPAATAKSLLARTVVPELPPPQVVVSNIIGSGIDDPTTSLGGYAAAGVDIPMMLVVGRHMMHLVVDHRVFNPPDEALLIFGATGGFAGFLDRVNDSLGGRTVSAL
jgi:hypothetical protein